MVGDTQSAADLDEIRLFAFTTFSQMQGFLVAGTIYMGTRLGLYRALAEAGGLVSAEELAEATGLHPRWVLEWLRAQGAAGLLDHADGERFGLSPAGVEVLANEDSLFYAAGRFANLPLRAGDFDAVTECFRTGVGRSYDARGPEGAVAVEGAFANWYRHMLVPVMLPALDGVVDKLETGARAADVGCGAGIALLEMAKTYPRSEFHGYEVSAHALDRARANRDEAGVDNVTFHHVADEPLSGDESFDLVMTLDCVHDMTRPDEVIHALRAALRDDGTWLWGEIKAHPTYEENVEANPMAPMMYAMSLVACMASAMSEPGGAGLGTLGISERKAREMAGAAGFTRFEVHDFGNPVNLYYEVRP